MKLTANGHRAGGRRGSERRDRCSRRWWRHRPAGLRAVRQAATALAVLKVQVAVPVAPAVAWVLSACSAIWPPVVSQRSVQPVGGVAPGVELSKPRPPISIAPLLAVVTLGTAMLVAL